MSATVGDFVKGTVKGRKYYGITNENMTRGLVSDEKDGQILVKVLKHSGNGRGAHWVDPKFFEVIGHVKPFDREAVLTALKSGDAKVLLEYNLRRANLSGADLSDANLSGADLSDADLSDANLRRADLSGANLSGANLRRANLSGADLSDADLSGADLSDANLRRADLSDADLSDANLSGADLSGAKNILSAIKFIDAHFERVEDGYIAYKTFGSNRRPPESWKIEKGSVVEENVNFDRAVDCACGVNVAPLVWVKTYCPGREIWKVLIRFEWLAGVCVPYMSDGKIRCEKVELLEIVEA